MVFHAKINMSTPRGSLTPKLPTQASLGGFCGSHLVTIELSHHYVATIQSQKRTFYNGKGTAVLRRRRLR